MLLRWWHERIRYKPYRPVVEALLLMVCAVVGAIGQLLKALWRWLCHYPAPPPLTLVPRRTILCLRPDRIGDVVLLTPALMALRACCPEATITLLTSDYVRPLIEHHPAVDEAVSVPGDRLVDFWRGRALLRTLRQQRFDMILVFESVWSCALLARWLGGMARVGYDVQGVGWLFTHALRYPYRWQKTHQVRVDTRLVAALGCPQAATPGALHVPVSGAASERARTWLSQHGLNDGRPVFMVHPGSRARYTQWSSERFGAVANWLIQTTGGHLLILCGRGEEPLVSRMQQALSVAAHMIQGWSLTDVVGLMSYCALFLGNSTGTTHLASAVGPLTVMLIGGTHPLDCPERWRPWGERHLAVHKSPREIIGRDTERWLGAEGLDHIQPQDVIAALRQPVERLMTSRTAS